jgi:UDP-N-acetylglucosamine 3-dehydrogenase
MLAKESLDIVSICLWPHLHAPLVVEAAQAGVKAIHCEKPMAPTWEEAKKMMAICDEQNVQLTFNRPVSPTGYLSPRWACLRASPRRDIFL